MCKRSNALSRPVLMVRGLDGYLILRCRRSRLNIAAHRATRGAWRKTRLAGGHAVQFSSSGGGAWSLTAFGGDSEGATPLPIPNRAVKPLSADGTWASRPWESRSPPFFTRAAPRGGPSFCPSGWPFVLPLGVALRFAPPGGPSGRPANRNTEAAPRPVGHLGPRYASLG